MVTDKHYVEVLTPKLSAEDIEAVLERFDERYQAVLAHGHIVSVPDNPMGVPRYQVMEVLAELGRPIIPEQFLLHINSFHTKQDLHAILDSAVDHGVRQLLVVTGDGGERLPKLKPDDIGSQAKSATSIDMITYIRQAYPDRFVCGVAFNPYEPQEHEMEKLERKVDAGASFVITQPVMGRHPTIDTLRDRGVPIALGAWMSKNLELLSNCVGYELAPSGGYDPMANLATLREHYPDCGIYLSLLNLKKLDLVL